MGQTIVEKIFSKHYEKKLSANDFVLLEPDYVMSHEGLGPIAIEGFTEQGLSSVRYPEKTGFIIDHSSPSLNVEYCRRHQIVRDFARKQNCFLYEAGDGVIHQVFAEQGHFEPGYIVIGGDSHTCTAGALNLFATGVGATDLAMAFSSGKMWYRVPASVKVRLNGSLKEGVSAKDLVLTLVKKIGVSGATYKCLEFDGELLSSLNMDSRFTISNMAIEMGAKAGIFPGDEITAQWFKKHGKSQVSFVSPDPDALYAEIVEIDAGSIEPVVAVPYSIDNVEPVKNAANTRVSLGVIGTCTNGRLEDLRAAAKVLKGRKVSRDVTLLIVPASRQILLEAMNEGLIETFIKAGAVLMPPGCGPCSGNNPGVPGDGENVISTANRNFKGRMGSPKAHVYLGSPQTVAASVIKGYITDPRELGEK